MLAGASVDPLYPQRPEKKTTKRKRRLNTPTVIHKSDEARIKRLLGVK